MNRNQIVTLDKLVDGDRFYKYGSKKKTVMVVKEITSKSITREGIDTVTIVPADQLHWPHAPDLKKITKPKEYQVVFLRHEIEIA